MPDNDTLPPETETPRWELVITPSGGGESTFQIHIHADDVVQGELVFCLLKVAHQLASRPGQRLPTIAEVQAAQARQQVLATNPARRIYARPNNGVMFLGENALADADLLTQLSAAGWSDVGEVPADVIRPCERAADPDGFAARHLTAS